MLLDPKTLQNYLEKVSQSKEVKVLVAYSGGLDSHVLLHLVSQIPEFSVRAIHIHHGLQTVADSWVAHCQKVSDELNTPLKIIHLNLHPKKGESIEQVARQGRYKALKNALQPDEILLTAQHQNDQSETLLLQLFRGAGVQGLASMPALCDFGKGQHARPLLAMTREELEKYAQAHTLIHIEDPSNQDTSFDRNYLRKEILPKLRQRWLGLDKALNRSASIQAETKLILDEIAEEDLIGIKSNNENTLDLEMLSKLSYARQKLLLRYWINQSGFKTPSEKKLQHIFTDAIQARKDAQPLVEWQGAQIRRFNNQLYIMPPLSTHDSSQSIVWNTSEALTISSLNLVLALELLHEKNQTVTVRFRQGGELYFSPKRKRSITLKQMLSEANIPPWQRSRIPLIYTNKKLIQIIGLKPE